jgi:hypothetical protein
VILEDRHMRDARVQAQFVIARLIGAQNIGDMRVRHQRHRLRVIRRFDDHIVDTEPLNRPPRAMNGPRRRNLARQGRKLVRYHAYLPRPISVRQPENFGGRQVLISRTERTVLHK